MRRWGIVVTLFYAVFVVFLLVPLVPATIAKNDYWKGADSAGAIVGKLVFPLVEWHSDASWWLWVGMLVGGQALLLFLSVDTSRRMLRPRGHVAVTFGLAALLLALLSLAAVLSLAAGAYGDKVLDWALFPLGGEAWDRFRKALLWLAALWAVWGAVFYLHLRGVSQVFSSAVTWLLRGSVLELLIAVPSHIWVQRRDVCSAPVVTGFGIATGIAVMLLCFGPGVLALYKKRIDRLSAGRPPGPVR